MREIKAEITALERFIRRLKQCVTCGHNPKTCGCNDADEGANGMCTKWVDREEK